MDIYSGVRWSAVAKYSTQCIEVVVSIIVARLVAPEAYGLLSMAVVVTGFVAVFQDLGFGSALIQRKEINESLLSSLFFVGLAAGAAIAAGLLCASPFCSWVYHDPRVGPIVAVLSITFLLSSPGLVPWSLLTRRLEFRRLAWIEISVSVVRSACVLSLAVAGAGVWALVWPSIVGAALNVPLVFLASRWRPRWHFSWSEVRSVFGFGANVTGFSIVNYFARNADAFIIGVFLGAGPLGFYSMAYGIMLKPRDAVTSVLMRVLFPAFSRMQDDDARLNAAYLRTCGAIAFVTFPMMLGLLAVAQPFVQVVLGAKWLPIVPLIYVFAPLGAVQSVSSSVGNLFLAKGRADWFFRCGVIGAILSVGSFLLGLPWGIFGVALSYTLMSTVWSVACFFIAFRLLKESRLRTLAQALQPYIVAAGSMALLVTACRHLFAYFGFAPSVVLMVCVTLGIVSYAAIAVCLWPPALDDLLRLAPKRLAASLRYLPDRLRPAMLRNTLLSDE